MTTKEYFEVIDFSPMFKKIKENGLKLSFLAKKAGKETTAFMFLKSKTSLPSTDLIATVAAYCHCPISELVTLKGFELRDFFREKAFVHPVTFEGKVTYRPLRVTVQEHKQPGQTIQDLYDRVEKKVMNNNAEKAMQKMLEVRGLTYNNDKQVNERGVYIDKNGIKRRTKGLSSTNRAKLNRDEPVSFRIIYELCKVLRCNVDFVIGWR